MPLVDGEGIEAACCGVTKHIESANVTAQRRVVVRPPLLSSTECHSISFGLLVERLSSSALERSLDRVWGRRAAGRRGMTQGSRWCREDRESGLMTRFFPYEVLGEV